MVCEWMRRNERRSREKIPDTVALFKHSSLPSPDCDLKKQSQSHKLWNNLSNLTPPCSTQSFSWGTTKTTFYITANSLNEQFHRFVCCAAVFALCCISFMLHTLSPHCSNKSIFQIYRCEFLIFSVRLAEPLTPVKST